MTQLRWFSIFVDKAIVYGTETFVAVLKETSLTKLFIFSKFKLLESSLYNQFVILNSLNSFENLKVIVHIYLIEKKKLCR